MTPEQISAAFGVDVLSVNFPTFEEDELERDRRAGKRG